MDKPIPHADTRCHLVLTTLPSREAAQAIARTLVEERRAACVQVTGGLQSIYRWQGRIDESEECQLVAKAPATASPALVDRLRALHPYEVPEILTVEASADSAYAAWLHAEVAR